jgi:hypothetical protein
MGKTRTNRLAKLPPLSASTLRRNPALAGHDTGPAADVELDPLGPAPEALGLQARFARASVCVHSFRHRLADADGVSAKWAVDSLVKAGLLPDDGPRFVTEVRFRQTQIPRSEDERTEILIEEAL